VKAVNLIPSDQRPAAKTTATAGAKPQASDSPLGAYMVLGALVFAIAASALYVVSGNSIKEKKAELTRVEHEAEGVERQASALQAFADFKQLSQARLDTVKGLATTRFAWPETLDDMSRALPDDVFINSFDGTTVSAGAGSDLRGSIQAPSIELAGCTRDQASVARLMSRLRDVRGVTRVTLAKSERTDTPETASAPSAATATDGEQAAITTTPCPAGSPPAFDMIVFFERSAVNANAAPNASVSSPSSGAAGGPTGSAGPTGSSGTSTTSSNP
jgi:Tfp pilus assembly protein PilN